MATEEASNPVDEDAEAAPLAVWLITGLSGAGRSEAANVLEDLGFFVIDNLPPPLITKVAELARGQGSRDRGYGLVSNITSDAFREDYLDAIAELRTNGAVVNMLFLDASEDALLRRYELSRRRHPLDRGEGLVDAIERERVLLEPIRAIADVVIDTSELNVHQLRSRVREIFVEPHAPGQMQVVFTSFGYKHGLPRDVDFVFDVRLLPNPYWEPELRPQTGLEDAVRDFVLEPEESQQVVGAISHLLDIALPGLQRAGKSYVPIAIGCTGGHHRSVAVAEELAKRVRAQGFDARVRHRDVRRGS
ncbi:MAG: RNase adapter RapZ [Acidimicrobiia bacterium]|nr:RNase adapter RapZ [Acidimicrobiia bacterium]MBP8181306.1 RNase adapter RapZ [Acidimicrobiia bacterium]